MDPDVWFDLPINAVAGGAMGCATAFGYLLGIGMIILPILVGCRIMLFLFGV